MILRSRFFAWTLALGFALFLFCACGGAIPGLDAVGYLLFGWIAYINRVAPKIQINWNMAFSAVIYAALLLIGSHLFLRWLYREMSKPSNGQRWRFGWTLSAFCLVIVMFAAGIAVVGIVHQTAWLARSPVPIWHSGFGRPAANRIKCASNLRQIGMALAMYAKEHNGKYPGDLAELLTTEDVTPAFFVCPSSNDVPATGKSDTDMAADMRRPGHCSYIYLGKGLIDPVGPSRVIAVENPENHESEGMNVLYGDGHTDFLPQDDAIKLLRNLGLLEETGNYPSPPSTRP